MTDTAQQMADAYQRAWWRRAAYIVAMSRSLRLEIRAPEPADRPSHAPDPAHPSTQD